MMYGHEKSRSAIVAVKPTNKAERTVAEQSAAEPTAAEPVERRAETKGNVDQQRTRRAQRRISVSQMLARIRQQIVAVDTQGGNRMRESCMYGSLRGGARQLASLPRPSPVHDAARRRRDSRAIRRAVNRSSSGGQGYQRGSSRYASGSAAAAVLANQLPRVVSCADACLPRIVRLNMPSRLRSATVIPAMRLSQGPADDGVQTPRRL